MGLSGLAALGRPDDVPADGAAGRRAADRTVGPAGRAWRHAASLGDPAAEPRGVASPSLPAAARRCRLPRRRSSAPPTRRGRLGSQCAGTSRATGSVTPAGRRKPAYIAPAVGRQAPLRVVEVESAAVDARDDGSGGVAQPDGQADAIARGDVRAPAGDAHVRRAGEEAMRRRRAEIGPAALGGGVALAPGWMRRRGCSPRSRLGEVLRAGVGSGEHADREAVAVVDHVRGAPGRSRWRRGGRGARAAAVLDDPDGDAVVVQARRQRRVAEPRPVAGRVLRKALVAVQNSTGAGRRRGTASDAERQPNGTLSRRRPRC